MTAVDIGELVMLVAGVCVAAINVFAAYRLSVTYSHGRKHAFINYITLLLLVQWLILMGITWLFNALPAPLLIVVLGYFFTVAYGLLMLAPLAVFASSFWYATHFKALARLKARNKPQGV